MRTKEVLVPELLRGNNLFRLQRKIRVLKPQKILMKK